MKRLIVLVLALVAIAIGSTDAYAQRPTVPVNTAFQIQGDHDGTGVPANGAYRLYLCAGVVTVCNTQLAQLPGSARVASTITFNVAGRAAGSYTAQLSGVNGEGTEGAKSPALVFDVVVPAPPPPPPTNLRIVAIQTAANGTQSLRYLDLAELRKLLTPPPTARLEIPNPPVERPIAALRSSK
jgi:hypothetical protein